MLLLVYCLSQEIYFADNCGGASLEVIRPYLSYGLL